MYSGFTKIVLASALMVGLLAFESTQESEADLIKVPGSRFNSRRAKNGRPFKMKGWRTDGKTSWFARHDSVIKNDFAVLLESGSKMTREVTIPKLPSTTTGKDGPKKSRWVYFLSADVGTATGAKNGKTTGTIEVRLAIPGTSRVFRKAMKVRMPGIHERLLLPIEAEKLKGGAWSISLKATGKSPLLIDNVLLLRTPTDPTMMKFAKPNGKNGPDRLDSGTLGFVGQAADEHTVLPVVDVRGGSPAAEAGLLPGDIILSINDTPLRVNSCKPGFDWFENSHEAVLGRASEQAFGNRHPRISMTVFRNKQRKHLRVRLRPRPPLPENFPFDDEVTPRLYDDVMDFVRRTRNKGGYWANGGNEWIQTSFAGLALLGRRDPQDYQTIREIANWFMAKFPTPDTFGNLGFWTASYAGIFLTEYYLATGDQRVRSWIVHALRWIEDGFHTSKWGMPALGHGPSGLPYGQKALMAPASHVIVFEALANKAGIKSTIWKTLLPYMKISWSDPKQNGHGAMGYNASYRDLEQFWSRSGLFALATVLRGTEKYMRKSLVKIMTKRHAYMRNSHAYGNPGDVWGLVGLFCSDSQAFAQVMKEWRWAFGGAWELGYGLRHSMAHMGSPYMGGEGLINPAMAMLLSVRHRGLFITGAGDENRNWLKFEDETLPDGAIRITRDANGLVQVGAMPGGLPLRYTTNGDEPDSSSPLYQGPFHLDEGGLVLARVDHGDGTFGKVSRQELGLSKGGWRIVAASGSKDPKDAIKRARKLIDGDDRSPWQPDRGQDAPGFPFTVTIDLKDTQSFCGLIFTGKHVPKEVEVAWGESLSALKRARKQFTTTGKRVAKIDFGELVSARYLFVAIQSVRKNKIRFGEMDLLWPKIVESRKGQSIILSSSDKGLTLRYEIGDHQPNDSSKKCRGAIVLGRNQVLSARYFDKSGHGVGPVRKFLATKKK